MMLFFMIEEDSSYKLPLKNLHTCTSVFTVSARTQERLLFIFKNLEHQCFIMPSVMHSHVEQTSPLKKLHTLHKCRYIISWMMKKAKIVCL